MCIRGGRSSCKLFGLASIPGSAERGLGLFASCFRRQLPSAWWGWIYPELVATKNATKTLEAWPPVLSRLAPPNPASAAGKLHLGRSLWLSAPSLEILRIKAFLLLLPRSARAFPPSILRKENCGLAGGKGLAQGLPAKDHKKNPDLRDHRRRKSWVRPSSVLRGGRKRTQKPDTLEANRPPVPTPFQGDAPADGHSSPSPGPHFSQPSAPLRDGAARLLGAFLA